MQCLTEHSEKVIFLLFISFPVLTHDKKFCINTRKCVFGCFVFLCSSTQRSSINIKYCIEEGGMRHRFLRLPCLSAGCFASNSLLSLLSTPHPSFNSYHPSAGSSRELVTGWGWWKAALWAILSLPCAGGVSLHLTEPRKLTGSGRHLNKRGVVQRGPPG